MTDHDKQYLKNTLDHAERRLRTNIDSDQNSKFGLCAVADIRKILEQNSGKTPEKLIEKLETQRENIISQLKNSSDSLAYRHQFIGVMHKLSQLTAKAQAKRQESKPSWYTIKPREHCRLIDLQKDISLALFIEKQKQQGTYILRLRTGHRQLETLMKGVIPNSTDINYMQQIAEDEARAWLKQHPELNEI